MSHPLVAAVRAFVETEVRRSCRDAAQLLCDRERREAAEPWPGRTIREADCTWFALLTMNQHPVHSDAHTLAEAAMQRVLVRPPTPNPASRPPLQ